MGLVELAGISIPVEMLVNQCLGGQEVQLDLTSRRQAHATESGPPRIKISLSVTDPGIVVGSLVTEAQNAADSVAVTFAGTAAQHIDDAAAAISSIQPTLVSLGNALSKIDVVVKIVDDMAEVHPYAKFAWTLLSSAYKQTCTDQTVVDLMKAMEALYSFVSVADNLVDGKLDILRENIKTILLQTVECATFMKDYAHRGFVGRVLHGVHSDDAGTCKRLMQGFCDLRANFETGIGVQTAFVSCRTLGIVTEIRVNQILDGLMPADMHAHQHSECLPATRQELLSRIISWATDINCEQNVFWLHGVAGSGKSTISTTVASYLGEMHRLGAFIFFDRGVADQSHPSRVIQILAHKLGKFDKRIGKAISDAMEGYPGLKDTTLPRQFTELLVKPLKSLASLQNEGAIVVILDALDECGSDVTRADLLQVLKTQLHQTPSFIRILITSRPLNDIRGALKHQKVHNEGLDISSIANSEDISAFFHAEMNRAKEVHQNLPPDWPGDKTIDELTSRAFGLFIWASTASRFIRDYAPTRRLEAILAGNATEAQTALDQLYKTTLESAGIWNAHDRMLDFHNVLSIILAAQRPLTISAIKKLLSVSQSEGSADIVPYLYSVLSYDLDNPATPVQILHPSFADFLFDANRSGQDVHINKDISHKDLAIVCLKRLCTKGLQRNICNLTLACQDWYNEGLAEDITYACIFWVDHLLATADSSIALIVLHIEVFLQKHLLHWFEAMSILGKSRETIRLLSHLLRIIPVSANFYHDLYAIIHDAWRFVQQFAAEIEGHPLLVYHSALPFSPRNSLTYKRLYGHGSYAKVTGLQDSWSPMLLRLTGHQSDVWSVAFSPDGTRIVSGSGDETIHVWDASTGTQVLPPIQGHHKSVLSVSFSPDGTHIVSSSEDKTICVWDVSTGTQVLPPMQGHQGSVKSVAFSPNGTHIVSGSADMTICVWDISTGTQVLPPIQGHQGWVLSVAFSSDGTRIVSGSSDRTICVWDASTGTQVLPPIHGHQGWIISVAFSPNGHIVSGSSDKTICVWDASTSTQVLPPIQGHQGTVQSVAFSSDGTRIVSGSSDRTICVWDASTGTQVLPPIQGHQGWVLSVAFSPDGTRIVSGSWDKTICVWDASTGTQVLPPIQGHHKSVQSVAFSPDGTHIVSGSDDKTICVWDAFTGTQVLPPIQGHQGSVESVAFSPDGTHILTHDDRDVWLVWDARTGLLSTSYNISNFTSFSIVLKGQWIVDQYRNQTLGKIPSHISYRTTTSWGTLLAIGCYDGKVILVDFAPLLHASSETKGVITVESEDESECFVSEGESSVYVITVESPDEAEFFISKGESSEFISEENSMF
ncbi:WD40 repeat-like protein [Leucogyrophana mollusca]|uniref:WD40 repeat-like protein n=1 Tax=Leucogyrophana mollusca TaxID=85980 RepID=A0ACB8AY08_9AGAM|nr:WD40 repeat-like protein [Leucogyrophana mollusca]